MLILNTKRLNVLKALMPTDSCLAEIGVAKGTFSKQIVNHVNPKELYLIDPWVYQDRSDYTMDGTNVSDQEGDSRYQHLVDHFASHPADKKVELMRGFSYDAVKNFEEESLDGIYVDAMHTYEAVKQDLHDFSATVKPDGLIAGHDFTNSVFAKRKNFGVVPAVSEFLKETGYTMLCVTNENYPSYFIHKGDKTSEACQERLNKLISMFDIYAELSTEDYARTQHNLVLDGSEIVKSYFTLAA